MAPDDAKPLAAASPADDAGAPPPLDSRYTATSGRIFLTGTQALVRMMLDQARLDAAAGLATGGLVSGYRGSPLATFDVELWRANHHLDRRNIDFLPAVNEDMAAWHAILNAAADIRGFGPVKMAALARVQADVTTYLEDLSRT